MAELRERPRWRRAYAVASLRLPSSSFDSTLPTWCSTVLRVMNKRSAIAGLERRLRGLLGDATLLRRSLALAAQGAPVHR